MVDQDVLERYIAESGVNMSDTSKQNLQNLITKFFNQKSETNFSDLKKDDLIEMFSLSSTTSISYFTSHKSKINDFAKWMYENGLGTSEILSSIASINYSDINQNRVKLFRTYYFRDIYDLYATLNAVFQEYDSEFDTFKTAAILVWSGIEINALSDVLKKDLNVGDKTIIHPKTKETVNLPSEPDEIIYFLERYKDADSYDTNKLRGRSISYLKSEYLLRTYKNAHLTIKQANHLSVAANRIAKKHDRVFQWSKIYLSGLYYRIYQFENKNGEIDSNVQMLKEFFYPDKGMTNQLKSTLIQKYKEYREFKEYAYL